MANIEISEWYPIPDIWLSADFSQQELVISQKDWEISVNLSEKDALEFVRKTLMIVKKVEEIFEDFDIDTADVKDLERKRSEISAFARALATFSDANALDVSKEFCIKFIDDAEDAEEKRNDRHNIVSMM